MLLNDEPTTTVAAATTTADAAVTAASVDVVLNGVPIVREASLEIRPGEMVAILGNNGSGKTTLMRALLGLVPHRGRIALFGTDLDDFRDWRRVHWLGRALRENGAGEHRQQCDAPEEREPPGSVLICATRHTRIPSHLPDVMSAGGASSG